MSDNSTWKKKMPSRIYDYNYKVSEGYYQPQTDYITNRSLERERLEPPKHKTYAERFAYKPWYGGVTGLPYDEKNSALSEPLFKPSERQRGSSLVREIKDYKEENIPLHIRASRRRKKFEEEERKSGITPKSGRTTSLTEAPISKLNDVKREIEKIKDNISHSSNLNSTQSSYLHYNYPEKIGSGSDHIFKNINQTERNHILPASNSSYSKIYHSTNKSSYLTKPASSSNHNISNGVGSTKIIESVFRPWPIRSTSFSGDAPPPVSSSRADKYREMKRAVESKDVSASINSMVDKMRAGKLDENAAYSFATNLRSTSLEPLSGRGSRKGRMIYGIAK